MQLGDIPRGERLTVGAPYKKQSLSRQPVGKAGRLGWWRANSRQAALFRAALHTSKPPRSAVATFPHPPWASESVGLDVTGDCRSPYIRSAT